MTPLLHSRFRWEQDPSAGWHADAHHARARPGGIHRRRLTAAMAILRQALTSPEMLRQLLEAAHSLGIQPSSALHTVRRVLRRPMADRLRLATGAIYGVGDDLLGGGTALPAPHIRALVGLEILVDVEELGDLAAQVPGRVIYFVYVGVPRSPAGTARILASVNITVTDIDIETVGTDVTIEGDDINIPALVTAIENAGAAVHAGQGLWLLAQRPIRLPCPGIPKLV